MKLRLAEWRRAKKLSQEALGELSGFAKSQISRWESGERSPDVAQLQALADALGVHIGLMFENRPLVPVVGRVGAGQEAFSLDDHAKGEGFYKVLCPDFLDPKNTVAVEVEGDSMLPILPGWLLFYSRPTDFGQDDVLNRLCVVKTESGSYFVKRIRPGYTPGTYNLISTNADPMESVRLEWAAPVMVVMPKEKVLIGG